MEILGLNLSYAILWLILAVVLLVVEALTSGLTTIWFAAGAFIAMLCAILKLSIQVQVIVFIAASFFMLAETRKIFVEKLKTGVEKTNTDALIGEIAPVIKDIRPFEVGIVKVGGQDWSAIASEKEKSISAGNIVKIEAIEGVKLIVSEYTEQEEQ